MENRKLIIDYVEYGSLAELPNDARQLMERAMEAARSAYAPYSNFHVGAAVRLADNTIVIGNNQENLAYPSGLCGERVALFSASAQHPDQPVTALVPRPSTPTSLSRRWLLWGCTTGNTARPPLAVLADRS